MRKLVSFGKCMSRDFKNNRFKYFIILPVIVYFLIFHYKPMYGIVIAFQRFRISLGITGSPWVGFGNFQRFFEDIYFWRVVRNTFAISLLSIVFAFPMPIVLALLLNEVQTKWFKRSVQTISYIPHFISVVVVCSMVKAFCQTDGVINDMIVFFGGERNNLLADKNLFYPILIISNIWQNIGWDSIIYLAALSGIDQEQYEAAKVDGAGRLRQMISITLPGLLPTISVLLVLRLGGILGVGFEKILLLYQPLTYEVADVISTYVYRKGMIQADYSYSTAIGMFNSIVNIVFLLASNKLSKKLGQSGLF